MRKLITIVFGMLTLIACTQNEQAISDNHKQNQKLVKNFTEWCDRKLTLPVETRHTVEILLKEAGT